MHNLAELDKAVTDFLNKLPGMQAETSQSLQLLANVMVDDIQRGRDELSALLNEPLPHQAVQDWFANVRAEADKAAREQAEKKKEMFAPPGVTPDAGGGVVENGQDNLGASLDKLRTQYASESELLLDKTLAEQEILIAAEQAKLLSEQESQALRKQSWDAYYQSVDKEAQRSAQQQAQAQAQANNTLMQMQMNVMKQAIGLIKSTAKEGSAVWMAALVVEKGIAIAQAIMFSEVAAVRALAELGPVARRPRGAIDAGTRLRICRYYCCPRRCRNCRSQSRWWTDCQR